MSEEADLQAKIAALSGKINQHKQHTPYGHPASQYSSAPYPASTRWSPYARRPPVHKNRTLVLNTPSATQQSASPAHVPPESEARVRQTTNRIARPSQEQGEAKRRKVDAEAAPSRELDVDGIRFRMLPDGSKLIRVSDETSSERAAQETPRKVTIAGVTFLRTKHGNLIRSSSKARTAPKSARPQCEHFTKNGTYLDNVTPGLRCSRRSPNQQFNQLPGRSRPQLLTIFTGTCPFGPRCKFNHDPSKVAICKDFLRTASCQNGANCDLSHEMSYHRVPACTYFLRGNCTNDACRYPHVHVSPAASVCRPFAKLGYCPKGPKCDKRHVSECPDYANHGHCAERENGKCQLPHPDHASTMHKVADRQAKLEFGGDSDVSSEEEKDDEDDGLMDVDSDVAEELTGSDEDHHELSQQQDYVAF